MQVLIAAHLPIGPFVITPATREKCLGMVEATWQAEGSTWLVCSWSMAMYLSRRETAP